MSFDDEKNETGLEEPFSSTLTYVEQQQQRLDDSFSNSSRSSRLFRCSPLHDNEEEDDEGGNIRSIRSSGVDMAHQFLMEDSFDDEPETVETGVNADLLGFLAVAYDDQSSNMWDEYSHRGLHVVDQSINLMASRVGAVHLQQVPTERRRIWMLSSSHFPFSCHRTPKMCQPFEKPSHWLTLIYQSIIIALTGLLRRRNPTRTVEGILS